MGRGGPPGVLLLGVWDYIGAVHSLPAQIFACLRCAKICVRRLSTALAAGTLPEVLANPHSLTAKYLTGELMVPIPKKRIKPSKEKGWIEVAGCGMVDPAVFEEICKKRGDRAYDPEKVSGFAFGFGLERMPMLRYGVEPIKPFFDNDDRFLSRY